MQTYFNISPKYFFLFLLVNKNNLESRKKKIYLVEGERKNDNSNQSNPVELVVISSMKFISKGVNVLHY